MAVGLKRYLRKVPKASAYLKDYQGRLFPCLKASPD